MIKALRRKFIISTMALLLVVFGIMLTLLNLAVRSDRKQTALNEMYALSAASRVPRFKLRDDPVDVEPMLPVDPAVPDPVPASGAARRFRRSWTDDMAFKEMYTVLFNENGEVIQRTQLYDFGLSEEELNSLTDQALKSNKENGTIDSYLFLKVQKTTGTQIILRNISEDISANRQMLVSSLLIGLGALAVLFIITLVLSRIVTQPAERAFTQQKQFIADASHELKTPLSAISVNAEVLKADVGHNKWLENIIQECNRMEELVLSLLSLAKLDACEKKPVAFETQNLSVLCSETVLSYESFAYEKHIELISDISDGVTLPGIGTELKQLFHILMDNAFKYANEHGTVSVSLKKADKPVLAVSNTGHVIDPEALPHLFERFYRADSSRSGEKSFGLGLAIASEIVKQHKGSISVTSRDGLTVFTVIF